MTKYDVVGIGNAIVDVLAMIDDAFLLKYELAKSGMTLIDEETARLVYAGMPPAKEISGGSAANTIAGLASFGANTAFIGKVHHDALGDIFSHDLKAMGVHYDTQPTTEGAPTARCLVGVSEDAERTMATYLGATKNITEDDVDEALIRSSSLIYLEGYLWDEEHAKAAMRKAMDIAVKHGVDVAFSLSDLFCVERHREEFLTLINERVDILFANEAEAKTLLQCDDMNDIVNNIRGHAKVAAITLGSKGSIVINESEQCLVDARQGVHVIDTTGAGDLYASGFLYGYTKGYDLETCGVLATLAAGEIIGHIGARPEANLYELAQDQGLLIQTV